MPDVEVSVETQLNNIVKEYFKELEECAGFELRLYSDTWPCITQSYLSML